MADLACRADRCLAEPRSGKTPDAWGDPRREGGSDAAAVVLLVGCGGSKASVRESLSPATGHRRRQYRFTSRLPRWLRRTSARRLPSSSQGWRPRSRLGGLFGLVGLGGRRTSHQGASGGDRGRRCGPSDPDLYSTSARAVEHRRAIPTATPIARSTGAIPRRRGELATQVLRARFIRSGAVQRDAALGVFSYPAVTARIPDTRLRVPSPRWSAPHSPQPSNTFSTMPRTSPAALPSVRWTA